MGPGRSIPPVAALEPVRIAGGLVYDVRGDETDRRDLLVEDGRIVDLVRPGTGGGRVVDAGRLFLLPGLIDCHVHLCMRAGDADPGAIAGRSDAEVAEDIARAARATIRGGVTTVRDLGGWNHLEMRVRDEIEAGRAAGPRVIAAGRLLSVRTEAVAYYPGMYEVVDGPQSIRAAVRAQVARGAQVIKVMATGAMLSPEGEDAGETQMSEEDLRAAVEEAAALGVPVAAHAHATRGIGNAVRAGVRSIEHGTWADEHVVRAMARRGTFLVPTLSASAAVLADPEAMEAMPAHIRRRMVETHRTAVEAVRLAHRAGVPIAMGTDAGTPANRHGANVAELAAMVEELGMSPEESIRASTTAAAAVLAREDLGALEPGRVADVIGCRADPRRDVRALSDLALVVRAGVEQDLVG